MSVDEQSKIKVTYYNEAIRYMENAKENLKRAGKEDRFYQDIKYVKTACGVAYNGVLVALDGYFLLKDVEKRRGRKSIQYYETNLAKVDKKLLNYLNSAYRILHLYGYYDGENEVKMISSGFELAYSIIEKIKP